MPSASLSASIPPVEFLVPLETAIFIDSEGNRPNTAKIDNIIEKDRKRRAAH